MHLPDIDCQPGSQGSEIPTENKENKPSGDPALRLQALKSLKILWLRVCKKRQKCSAGKSGGFCQEGTVLDHCDRIDSLGIPLSGASTRPRGSCLSPLISITARNFAAALSSPANPVIRGVININADGDGDGGPD